MTGKKKATQSAADVALAWVESIRHVSGGYSENEKKLIALADEVKKTRRELRAATMKTRTGALRPVPTPADADEAAEQAMKLIDELGAPPLPRAAWIGLLEEIIGQCRTRIDAARDDDAHGRR